MRSAVPERRARPARSTRPERLERPAVTRHVVVWCPHWPVVASGIAPDAVAAVVRDQVVLAVSRAARAAGVRAGMRKREAQARCASLELVEHDESRDARRFEPVVRALAEIVPVAEVSEAGTVLFGARGPSRWCGGDAALAERVHRLVVEALGDLVGPSGLVDRIGVGIADGRFAAMVAARRSVRAGVPVLIEGGTAFTAEALAPVGVRALADLAGLPLDFVGLLQRLGLATLAEVRALPRADLGTRFGPDGLLAHRLASGEDNRHPDARPPAPDLAVVQSFEDPVLQLGPLVFTARHLADQLHERLASRGEVCTRLLVEAETEHGERSDRQWYVTGGLSAAAMAERVRWQLEGWVNQPGGLSAGVVLLRLAPDEVLPAQGRQLGFWGEASDADAQAARVITRLVGLLGSEAVLVPEWSGGRHPSDRYRWVPAAGTDVADPAARRRAVEPSAHPWPGSIAAPSPAWVADGPLPIEVFDASGATVRVDGRGVLSASPATVTLPAMVAGRTARQSITAWAGPWPTEEHWWDPLRRRRRARFQLLTDAGEALLVSLERGGWFLEGHYD